MKKQKQEAKHRHEKPEWKIKRWIRRKISSKANKLNMTETRWRNELKAEMVRNTSIVFVFFFSNFVGILTIFWSICEKSLDLTHIFYSNTLFLVMAQQKHDLYPILYQNIDL